jgi:protein MpaA
MRKYRLVFLFALFSFTAFPLSGQAGASYKAEGWPGSSKFRAVRNYPDFQRRVRGFESARIKVVEIASVTYDNVAYPILGLVYTPPSPPVLRVLLTGGQHGNEPAGPESVLSFFARLKANPKAYEDVAVDAIPMVNPWGWTHNTRQNANGYDTNRDYIAFVTAEARAVRTFSSGKRYDLVIDHHESSRDGAFIYCYQRSDDDLSRDLIRYLIKEGYAIASVGWNRFGSDERGVISIPGDGFSFLWRGRQVLPRYFTTTKGTPHAFLMETSTHKAFADRVAEHVKVNEFIIARLRTGE